MRTDAEGITCSFVHRMTSIVDHSRSDTLLSAVTQEHPDSTSSADSDSLRSEEEEDEYQDYLSSVASTASSVWLPSLHAKATLIVIITGSKRVALLLLYRPFERASRIDGDHALGLNTLIIRITLSVHLYIIWTNRNGNLRRRTSVS